MPEGDTIHRAAAQVGRALVGRVVVRHRAWRPDLLFPDRTGRRVLAVEARGKHHLVRFDDRRLLHSHMGMSGVWHVYRPGERWRRPRHLARVVLASDVAEAVCFSAPDIELLSEPELARHAVLSRLGPDLLGAHPDLDAAVARLRADPERPLGEALLDQRAVAGIGNVYKSEMLYLARLDPFAAVARVEPGRLRELLQATRRMMQRNLGDHRRRTREGRGPRLWVYEQGGLGCLRCHTRVRSRRQGRTGRTTWYCPRCQGVAPAVLPASPAPAI